MHIEQQGSKGAEGAKTPQAGIPCPCLLFTSTRTNTQILKYKNTNTQTHKYKYTKTNTGSKDPPGRKPCPCLLFTCRHPPPPLLHSKSSKHAAAAMPFGLCILASAVCKTLTVSVLLILHAQSISKAPPFARPAFSLIKTHGCNAFWALWSVISHV